MYDDDPVLYVAGAAGVGQLALTGSHSLPIVLIALVAIVGGLLLLRLAASMKRRVDDGVIGPTHRTD
jgi:hypothetical protein